VQITSYATTPMRAWLLTWVFTSTEPKEKVVAILPARRSDRSVAELMELLVQRAMSGAGSALHYLHRRKQLVHKAQTPLVINKVPHGQRVLCGHDPWLYGRVVSELKVVVDQQSGDEVLLWVEPDDWKFADGERSNVEVASAGEHCELRRPNRPLSGDVWPH
jgi:hypothetical protein